jgi:GT2 family glycosyltransferase
MTPHLIDAVLHNIVGCDPLPITVYVINNSPERIYVRTRWDMHLVVRHAIPRRNLDYNPSIQTGIDFFCDKPVSHVAFLNDDVVISKNFFQASLDTFATLPQAGAISPITIREHSTFSQIQTGSIPFTIKPPYPFRNKAVPWVCVFRNDVLSVIPPIPVHLFERYCGDTYLHYRLHELGLLWYCFFSAQCFHYRCQTTNRMGPLTAHVINRTERNAYLHWKRVHTDKLTPWEERNG